MKKKTVSILCGALVAISCFSLGTFASSTLQEIKAYLNHGITVKLDGQEQIMYNANNERVYPISYEGTTYVPIRAVSNMLGVDVEWDGRNNAVLLGETGEAKDFIEDFKPYIAPSGARTTISETQPTNIAGKQYSSYLRTTAEKKNALHYNLEGKYSTLTFDAYSESSDTTLQFYGDNDELLASIDIIGGNLPETHIVDVSNVSQLIILDTRQWEAYIFNATIE